MNFKTYEKYLAEGQSNAEQSAKLRDKAVDAKGAYNDLLAQYEAKMTESIVSGKDVTADLDKLDEKIDAAKRNMERAEREYKINLRVGNKVSLSKEDVIDAWNSEFEPQYYQSEIVPELEKLEGTKRAYLDAMCQYFDKVHAIEDFREEVSNQLGYEFPYKFRINKLTTQQQYDHYFISQKDYDDAQRRR